MKRKDRVEMERAKIAKAVRNAVRLKHSLLADEEINERLPAVLEQFDRAIVAGKPFELNVASVLNG